MANKIGRKYKNPPPREAPEYTETSVFRQLQNQIEYLKDIYIFDDLRRERNKADYDEGKSMSSEIFGRRILKSKKILDKLGVSYEAN